MADNIERNQIPSDRVNHKRDGNEQDASYANNINNTSTEDIASQNYSDKLINNSFPLLPIQQAWLTSSTSVVNLELFEINQLLDTSILKCAVKEIFTYHDALAIRISKMKGKWLQWIVNYDEDIVFTHVDITMMSEAEQDIAIISAATEMKFSIHLFSDSLIRFTIFDLGAYKPKKLLLAISHFIYDAFSLRILFEDLYRACQQLSQGRDVHLRGSTASFKQWSEYLMIYAQSSEVQQELNYWLRLPWDRVPKLPTDNLKNVGFSQLGRSVSITLNTEELMKSILLALRTYQITFEELLITAVALSISRWTSSQYVLIELVKNARTLMLRDINILRTFGWMVYHYPLLLYLEKDLSENEILETVKKQLRCIPNKGIGHSLLSYLSEPSAGSQELRDVYSPQIVVNYLGQMIGKSESLFKELSSSDNILFKELPAPKVPIWRPWVMEKRYRFVFEARMSENKFRLTCHYYDTIHSEATIKQLIQDIVNELVTVVRSCADE